MTASPPGSNDPITSLVEDFLGTSPSAAPPAVRRDPAGRLLTESANELLAAAGTRAARDGADLDTAHLLWAATSSPAARLALERAGVDPDRLAADLEDSMPTATEPGEPALTPATQDALHAAQAHAGPSARIGPEHLLAALLDAPGTGAGRALRAESATGPEDNARDRPGA
ncbi:Clp protease N-terminal domain-containing protein [Streptomyces sp. DSM 44917]|uniref:Clp protease N-terminal domain-containing protein n=1 Tax=Streptomyces boetiae TaxID=3075541 RepID=A0ABU2LGI5_9ACTN|nr:Clp protease N-terminal domain-containing protein [Streptomyces sp. DSM 44917]MDT0310631.1 Clp protease N-terminal domain-containing protein [Streptomyces sp. DSM 44917]